MIIKPTREELLERGQGKYSIVIGTAKRARQIAQGEEALVECDSENPVTIAAYEIVEDKVTYSKTKV